MKRLKLDKSNIVLLDMTIPYRPKRKRFNPMIGKKHKSESIEKMRYKKNLPENIEKYRLANLGKNNPNWKDDIGYHGLHDWLRDNLPKPELCERCEQKPPEQIANVTGIYLRDFNNWRYLCVSCHRIIDKTINNIKWMKDKT